MVEKYGRFFQTSCITTPVFSLLLSVWNRAKFFGSLSGSADRRMHLQNGVREEVVLVYHNSIKMNKSLQNITLKKRYYIKSCYCQSAATSQRLFYM